MLATIHDLISKSNGDSAAALVTVVKAIKDFDLEFSSDPEYQDKAKSSCKDIVFWLYLVSKDEQAIASIPSMGCTNEKLAAILKKLTLTSLSSDHTTTKHQENSSFFDQVEKSLKRPFEVLAASSSSTSDFIEKLTQL